MTTLHETRQIENFLQGGMRPAEQFLFEMKMTIDPALRNKVELQRRVYELVKMYGRRKLREEIERIHHRLFHDPDNFSFRQHIFSYFKK